MHRLATIAGHTADWGVFGAAFGLIGGAIFGVAYTDVGAVMTGCAALLVENPNCLLFRLVNAERNAKREFIRANEVK